ncbi:MAG TPA: aldo/keto reductase [Chloroflexota bacterium]|nr:aldo/keto reductase [Chloroflexota bacterium]
MATQMQYRKMGSSDLEVSVIGFGCWEIGGRYGSFDEQEVIDAVHRAIDLGVTLFDTALAYGAGKSEALLGRALGSRRNGVIVVTKGALPTRQGQKERRDARHASIMQDIEDSLRALKMDYVDLYLQHWPDPGTPIDESMRALEEIRTSGKARYVGVSNFHPHMLAEARKTAPIITNQVGYNLFDRRWERQMFPTARELGIGIMAYGPMAHGLLTGAFTKETAFEENDWRRSGVIFGQRLFAPEHFPQNVEVVERLKEVARDLDTPLAPLAIAWTLRDPIVSVALSGTRRRQEIEENVRAVALLEKLTPAVLKRIDGIMAGAAGQSDDLPV